MEQDKQKDKSKVKESKNKSRIIRNAEVFLNNRIYLIRELISKDGIYSINKTGEKTK